MGSLTYQGENYLLDHLTGKTSWTMPTTYVALSTTDFTRGGLSGTEPSTVNSYMRKITAGADWVTASAGLTDNANAITFNACSVATWGTIAYFALYGYGNATPGTGTPLAFGTVSPSKTVTVGDTVSFAVGDLDITAV